MKLKDYQTKAIEKVMKKDSMTLSFPVEMDKIQRTKEKKKDKDRDTR